MLWGRSGSGCCSDGARYSSRMACSKGRKLAFARKPSSALVGLWVSGSLGISDFEVENVFILAARPDRSFKYSHLVCERVSIRSGQTERHAVNSVADAVNQYGA